MRTVDAAAGANTLKLTTQQLGRRAGLYRLTGEAREGGAQVVQFRIKRPGSAPQTHATNEGCVARPAGRAAHGLRPTDLVSGD